MAPALSFAWTALLRDIGIGVAVGAFSGMFGVGGGLILVPILVLGLHVSQKAAQATSLVMVALAASAGAATYALGNSVAWQPSIALVVGGLCGTWAGTWLVQRIADSRLQWLFAGLLILAAIRQLWGSTGPDTASLPVFTALIALGYVAAGMAMGLLSSMFGVGGGVIVIPLLTTFFGFSQQLAAGTSLLVMIPIALLGAARLTRAGHTNWSQGLRIGIGALGGAVLGASLALDMSGPLLKVLFALVMLLAAAQMLQRAIRGGRVSRQLAPANPPSTTDPRPS